MEDKEMTLSKEDFEKFIKHMEDSYNYKKRQKIIYYSSEKERKQYSKIPNARLIKIKE